ASLREITLPPGTGTPAPLSTVLAVSFCIASADASTPECEYGMPSTSSMPCSVPSSPGRPCNTLSATSGLNSRNVAAISRVTSTRLTLSPVRSRASAHALPERRETSRSADHPPINTATCFIASAFLSDALDLPFQLDSRMRLHPFADGLAEIFDVGRGSPAEIDQEIAVQL